mmetsp:Transcript_12265/g.29993  ORF Transcript_12265/g.29993 Transcript_12265/m.29993 type:complete len:89 (-) Transcript_12265:1838-2104(-)
MLTPGMNTTLFQLQPRNKEFGSLAGNWCERVRSVSHQPPRFFLFEQAYQVKVTDTKLALNIFIPQCRHDILDHQVGMAQLSLINPFAL